MSGIYVSTGAFREGRLAEMAAACEALGAGLELSSGLRWHPGLEAEIEEVADRNVLVHNYFPPPEKPFVLNLASTDPETLERARQHVRAAIDLSARCRAPFYSVHSGFAMDLKTGDLGKPEAQARLAKVPYALACGIFRESVQALSAYAKERGVRLLIENNVITRGQVGAGSPLLMTEPAEIARFLRELNDRNTGLLLDVGHAKVSAEALGFAPGRFFDELAPWIVALHLSDNDGLRDSNQPFGPDAWFAPYYRSGTPAVIEVYKIEIDAVAKMVETVKSWAAGEPFH